MLRTFHRKHRNAALHRTLALESLERRVLLTLAIDLVSVTSAGVQGNNNSYVSSLANCATSISADGRFVAFESTATNLVADDTNALSDIFVYDRQTDTIERVNLMSTGAQATGGASYNPSISADGRYVAFESLATNLVAPDVGAFRDIFVYDRQTDTIQRVSQSSGGVQATNHSYNASISADGRYVAFDSIATNLVADDTNALSDIFVYDCQALTIQRVNLADGGTTQALGGVSINPAISGDGTKVAFETLANNLVPADADAVRDIYVRDIAGATTELVSVSSASVKGTANSFNAAISYDGRYVAFDSLANNLVVGDAGQSDVFLRDRTAGTTALVSVSSLGVKGGGNSVLPSITPDGMYISFESDAVNLVPVDINALRDIFVRNVGASTTEMVSLTPAGNQANAACNYSAISGDGRYVAFDSIALTLVPNDTNNVRDVFVARFRNTAPTITLDDPAVGATRNAGAIYTITWADADADPDDNATIDLYWDTDTSAANNTLPNVGVTWGVIATGISEDDPANSFGWTVNAPQGGNYYLYATIGDGFATGSDYTATTLHVNTPPSIALNEPPPDTRLNPGDVYTVRWTDSDPDDDAQIALYWDTDINPANNTAPNQGITWGTIATGISENDPANSRDWTVNAPAPGDCYFYAVIDDGLAAASDYTGGTVHVNAAPTITISDPAPAAEVNPGQVYAVTWTDADPDDNAQVALYWDVDTSTANNLLPNFGVTWGLIVSGISENDPVNSFGWTVNAPQGGDYYLYAVIDDGLASATDYTATTLHVNAVPTITLDEPAPAAARNPGDLYTIWWTDADPDDDAQIDLYWDTDTITGNNLPGNQGVTWGAITTGISENAANSFGWTVNAPAGGDYYLYAVINDGLASSSDYTGSTLHVNVAPTIVLTDPSVGTRVGQGCLLTVRWTDADPDNNALINLYWDADTNAADNTAPNEGIAWGTIFTGISENDPANSFVWTVNAPDGGDYYLYAVIDDGMASANDYTSTSLHVGTTPTITLDDPVGGTKVNPGSVYPITWTDFDPDFNAQISLYWDADTSPANNTLPSYGVTWKLVASGISEDAFPNTFGWTVDAPAAGNYYFYAEMNNGVVSVSDYTATTLHVNTPPVITLNDPAPGAELNLGDLYAITWTDSDPDDNANISLYWDADTDPANNTAPNLGTTWGIIFEGISEDNPANSFGWTVDAPQGGDYFLYAVIDDGTAWGSDYTGNTVHVNAPPTIALTDPAPGAVVNPGSIYAITWIDADPDDNAEITLYWDVDTTAANNLPGTQGTAWGVVATGVSENDPANSFGWTVNAPAGGDYYLYATIDDGLVTASDYTDSVLHVNAGPTIALDEPTPPAKVNAGSVYTIAWTDANGDAQIALYWDTDTIAGNNVPGNQGTAWDIITTGISEADPANSFDWTVNAPQGGDYYLYAVIDDGLASGSDYTATALHVNATPSIVLNDPAPGTELSPGDIYPITWTDSDPDDNAQVGLYWDMDTNLANNTAPNEGIAWGVIFTGISENDPANSFDWTVNVPGGDYYLLGIIDDGLASASDYTGTQVRVSAVSPIASHAYADGVTISIYDVDPTDGVSDPIIAWSASELRSGATDIYVNPGAIGDGKITLIQLRDGLGGCDDIGIAIEGNYSLGSLTDQRARPAPLAFLFSQGSIGTVTLRSDITGANLNGQTMPGGWALPDDIDGDGSTDDLTALYTPNSLAALTVYGSVGGDVVASRGIGTVRVIGGDLRGDVVSELGSAATVSAQATLNRTTGDWVGGNVSGDVRAKRDVQAVSATGGNVSGDVVSVSGTIRAVTATGAWDAGDKRYVGGSVSGSILAGVDVLRVAATQGSITSPLIRGSSVGTISALGGDVSADITSTTGAVNTVSAQRVYDTALRAWRGGSVSGDITAANGLRSLTVAGDLTGNLDVTGALGTVRVSGSALGCDINVHSALSSLWIGQQATGLNIQVDGLCSSVYVGGEFQDSDLRAGQLSRVTVAGLISGDGEDEIWAQEGKFSLTNAGRTLSVTPTLGYMINGVRVHVG